MAPTNNYMQRAIKKLEHKIATERCFHAHDVICIDVAIGNRQCDRNRNQ